MTEVKTCTPTPTPTHAYIPSEHRGAHTHTHHTYAHTHLHTTHTSQKLARLADVCVQRDRLFSLLLLSLYMYWFVLQNHHSQQLQLLGVVLGF